jgi:CheY-like chemotaxis protein
LRAGRIDLPARSFQGEFHTFALPSDQEFSTGVSKLSPQTKSAPDVKIGLMTMAPVFLLVEPAPILRFAMHAWLKDVLTDSRLLIASTGEEALRLAVQELPTHVLIDIDLSDRPGIEILKHIRQALPHARIIATDWYESRLFVEKVRCAGASEFVPKHKLHRELLPLLMETR